MGPAVVCLRWATSGARVEWEVGGAATIDAMNPLKADASAVAAAVSTSVVAAVEAVFPDLQTLARWWSL